MSWTEKYWDAVDQFYWAPQYIGLKSIPQRFWSIEGESVSIPKEMVNPSGPLYRRLRSGEDYWEYVRRQEETFNHIFSLAFAILPGDVIGELLGGFTGAGYGHFYESIGREFRFRYGWGRNVNITTPDGFFIAEGSILAVELKFNAKTSLDQLAKYSVLLAAEDHLSNKHKSLDLLYIFNRDPVTAFQQQAGFKHDTFGGHVFDDLHAAVSNKTVSSFLQDNEAAVRSALDRININCISWHCLCDALRSFSNSTGEGRGDRTLKKLVEGLMTEIECHPLSHVNGAGDGAA